MKLATYRDGSRDGQLVVVSRDLTLAHHASGIATKLQQVLDDWNFLSPQLEELSQTLNHGKARHAFAFDPRRCMAPLPRACQWADGSAYLSHLGRMRQAEGMALAQGLQDEPLMYQGASDDLAGACDDIVCAGFEQGVDFEGTLAVITGDLGAGSSPEAAIDAVRLLMLANAVSLRHMAPGELAKGFGFLQSKPVTAFSPVAATPDELLAAWQGGRVRLNLECTWNGKRLGLVDAGAEMHFHFGQLIAHLCKTRNIRAGSIVGSGAVSNQDASRGFSCIAEKRAVEALAHGAPQSEFLQFGDTVRIDMKGVDGQSLFGAIEQTVAALA